jgi:hypothetical protein
VGLCYRLGVRVELFVAAALIAAVGCGASTGPAEDRADASARDSAAPDSAAPDSTTLDSAAPDSAPARDASLPPRCLGTDEAGGITGFVPGFDFVFPFAVAGIDPPGAHSCPRLFIRAGDAADFSGDTLEIEVPMPDGATPGTFVGTLSVQPVGGELWVEEIQLEVLRADGHFDHSVPFEDRRASVRISYHDATTDLEGAIDDVHYCNDFAICI